MRNSNNVVAMLLAGGQGSRLREMTKNVAKPAVPFGGKYRIIDFALSNAAHSEIRDIGILTQYKPFELNDHLGNGSAWNFNRNRGGLKILSPYSTETGGRWYEGTANAIFENIDYLDSINPEYVLILSGDHIYKMNYKQLLNTHKENGAEATIAVMEVPWDEASRFGIMNADETGRIVEFEEKPAEPKSNLASMGIYMFNWPTLRKALVEDYEDEESGNDFGHDIIPKMLGENKPMYVYRFNGYWKDVGTIRSYWEANLDLLDDANELDLYDVDWRIYTKSMDLPPHFLGEDSRVEKVLVNEACVVHGIVENSVLFSGVEVGLGAEVKNSVLLPNSVVESGAKVINSVVMEDIIIEANQEVGDPSGEKVSLVSSDGIREE